MKDFLRLGINLALCANNITEQILIDILNILEELENNFDDE